MDPPQHRNMTLLLAACYLMCSTQLDLWRNWYVCPYQKKLQLRIKMKANDLQNQEAKNLEESDTNWNVK